MNEVWEIQCGVRRRRLAGWLMPALFFVPLFFLATWPDRLPEITNPDWETVKDPAEYMNAAQHGNVPRQIGLLMIGSFGLFGLSRPGSQRMQVAPLLGPLVLFFAAWSASSILWAGDPAVTMRKLSVFFLVGLGAFSIASRLSSPEIVMFALLCSAFQVIVLGVLPELALGTFQPWVAAYRLGGVFHPNSQGEHAGVMLLAACALISAKESKGTAYWVTALVALLLLLLTKSRAAVAGIILGFGFWIMIGTTPARKWLLAIAAAVLTCCLVLAFGEDLPRATQTLVFVGRTVNAQEGSTMNARVPLWKECVGAVWKSPIQGYGYDSFWDAGRLASMSDAQGWSMYSAHNAYLDIALGLGGVLPDALRQIDFDGAAGCPVPISCRRRKMPAIGHRIRERQEDACVMITVQVHNRQRGVGGLNVMFDAICSLLAQRGHTVIPFERSNDEVRGFRERIQAFCDGI